MQALQTIAGVIAADESRHEIAYTKIVDELFVRDPDGAMLAFAGAYPSPSSEFRVSCVPSYQQTRGYMATCKSLHIFCMQQQLLRSDCAWQALDSRLRLESLCINFLC